MQRALGKFALERTLLVLATHDTSLESLCCSPYNRGKTSRENTYLKVNIKHT